LVVALIVAVIGMLWLLEDVEAEEITLTLDPVSVPVNGTFEAYGVFTFDGSSGIKNENVNITIEKTFPLIYNETFSNGAAGHEGEYSVMLKAPSEPGSWEITATGWFGGLPTPTTQYLDVYVPSPDLMVNESSISFDPTEPLTGDIIDVNATIFNIGERNATCRVRFYEGSPALGNILHTVENMSINATSSNWTVAQWTAKSGYIDIYVVVDHVEPLDSNLTNNQAYEIIFVNDTQAPMITNETSTPPEPISGQKFNISCNATDDWILATKDAVVLKTTFNGTVNSTPMHAVGKSGYWLEIGPFDVGTLSISIAATDFSGNKNYRNYTMTIHSVNLTLRLHQLSVPSGTELNVSGNLTLSGIIPVSGTEVNITIVKSNPISYNITQTLVNGSYRMNLTTPLDAGDYEVVATIDYDGKPYSASAWLEVYLPYPDMAIYQSNISFTPDWPSTGDPIEFNTTVFNHGRVNGTCRVRYFRGPPADGLLLHSHELMAPVNGMNNSIFTWTALSGPMQLFVVVDHVLPSDLNLTNNQANISLFVNDTTLPSITNVVQEPQYPVAGEQVTITCNATDDWGMDKDFPVNLTYEYNGKEDTIVMTQIKGGGYQAVIGPFDETSFQVSLVARDYPGNIQYSNFTLTIYIIELTLELDSYSVPVGNQVTASGELTYSSLIAIEGYEVNITIDKSNPLEYAVSITGMNGAYASTLTAPLDEAFFQVTATVMYGGKHYVAQVDMEAYFPYPDMLVLSSEMSHNPKWPGTGDDMLLNASVHNMGRGSGTCRARFFLGPPAQGIFLHEENITLDIGGSELVTVPWTAMSGPVEVFVVLDHVSPADRNLTNNQASINLFVNDTELPVIWLPEAEPHFNMVGDIINLSCYARDDWGLDKTWPVNITFSQFEGNGSLSMKHVGTEMFSADIGPFSEGLVNISIQAKDLGGNNGYLNFSIWVYDVHISLTIDPLETAVGTEFNALGTVTLSDIVELEGLVVNVSVDKTDTQIAANGTSNENGQYDVLISAPLDAGVFEVQASVIYEGRFFHTEAELETYLITPDIELSSSNISYSPKQPNTGEKVQITFNLSNKGRSGGPCTLKFFDGPPSSGYLFGTMNTTVSAWGMTVISIVFNATSGPHDIYIVADHVLPLDHDLTNNQAYVSFYVNDTISPEFGGLITPEFPTAGERVNVTIDVNDDFGLRKNDPVMLSYIYLGTEYESPMQLSGTARGTMYYLEIGPFNISLVNISIAAYDSTGNAGYTNFSLEVFPSEVLLAASQVPSFEIGGGMWVNGSVQWCEGGKPDDGVLTVEMNGQEWADDIMDGEFSLFMDPAVEPGVHEVKVKVACYHGQLELRNSTYFEVLAYELWPDLFLSVNSITVQWPDNEDDELEVYVLVYNIGEKATTSTVKLYLGMPSEDSLLGTMENSIKPGQWHSFNYSWDPAPGRYTLTAIASSSVLEQEVVNNRAVKELEVPEEEEEDGTGDLKLMIIISYVLIGVCLVLLALMMFRSRPGQTPAGLQEQYIEEDVEEVSASQDIGLDQVHAPIRKTRTGPTGTLKEPSSEVDNEYQRLTQELEIEKEIEEEAETPAPSGIGNAEASRPAPNNTGISKPPPRTSLPPGTMKGVVAAQQSSIPKKGSTKKRVVKRPKVQPGAESKEDGEA